MKTAISKVWTGTCWVTVLPKTNAQAVEYEAGKSVYDVVEPLKAKVDNIRYAVVFENYASLVEALKVYSPSMDIYRVGHDFYIKTMNVPDLWVSGFSDEYVDYSYTTDSAFVELLKSNLGIQIGHTILSPLEAKGIANLDNIIDPIKEAIPLQSDYSFHYPKTYEQILKDIATYGDNEDLWRADGDYAFWYGRFNKTNSTIAPTYGELMEVTARTSDGYVLGMCVKYIGKCTNPSFPNQYSFMIDNSNMFVYHNPNEIALTLYNTMAFNGVTVEEFLATDANGDYTFKGTDGHHSIGIELFNKTPAAGDRFFGTTVLRVDEDDENPSMATFTAEVTGITNGKVDYKLIDATIIRAVDDTKLDKNTSTTDTSEVYAKKANGTQTMIGASTGLLVYGSIPLRGDRGEILVPEETVSDYSATSKKYVNNKLNTKLDKVSGATDYGQVYGKTAAGTQLMIDMSRSVIASAIPQRQTNGNIRVPNTPTADNDAASKEYVDTEIAKIEPDVNVSVTYDEATESLNVGNDEDVTSDVVVHRNSNGSITVPLEPSADTDAVSKKYVDNQKSMACTYYDITGGTQTKLKGEGYYMVYSNNANLKLCKSDGTALVSGAKQMQFMIAVQDKYPTGNYKACGQYWTGSSLSGVEGFRQAVDRTGYIICPTDYAICVMYKI